MDNSTATNVTMVPRQRPEPIIYFMLDLIFIIGALANILALWIIHRSSKTRNKKHVFLLRCLACNDLVAQIGMLAAINLNQMSSDLKFYTCAGFVLLRGFGIGSGCVAFVMALERWLALTRPFLYHQIVSYKNLKMFTFSLWGGAQLLTIIPLFGIGTVYDPSQSRPCVSYRSSTNMMEMDSFIYAYTFMAFGSVLCLCIALCNVTVVIELLKLKRQNRILVRRVSRSIINRPGCSKYQTPEEVAFAKLMAIICVIFVCCWVPQLVSVPLIHYRPQWESSALITVGNFLMCVYFTTDPFLYVLQRYNRDIWRFLLPCCFIRRSAISLNTGTTTTGTPTSVLLQPPSFTIPVNM